jgi:hypothetical protein
MKVSLLRQQAGETRRKLSKILQTPMRDVVDDVPVDGLVTDIKEIAAPFGVGPRLRSEYLRELPAFPRP